jgi:hypothetical protein
MLDTRRTIQPFSFPEDYASPLVTVLHVDSQLPTQDIKRIVLKFMFVTGAAHVRSDFNAMNLTERSV